MYSRIQLSSPTFSSAVLDLLPVLTVIVAILSRSVSSSSSLCFLLLPSVLHVFQKSSLPFFIHSLPSLPQASFSLNTNADTIANLTPTPSPLPHFLGASVVSLVADLSDGMNVEGPKENLREEEERSGIWGGFLLYIGADSINFYKEFHKLGFRRTAFFVFPPNIWI